MNPRFEAEDIESRLREVSGGEPPPRLLASLQEQIPEQLGGGTGGRAPGWHRHRWRLAAAVLVLGLGGLLAHRLVQEAGRPIDARPPAAEPAGPETPTPASGDEEAGRMEIAGVERPAAALTEPTDRLTPRPMESTVRPAPPPQEPTAERAAGEDRIEPLAGARDELEERRFQESTTELAPEPLAASTESPGQAVSEGRVTDRRAGDAGPQPGIVTVVSEAPLLEGSEFEKRKGPRRRSQLERMPAAPSTGGTTEPNDQPYGDMFFRSHGVNPFVDTEDDALSTFGLDVDTGSYTLARSYLQRGHLPPPEAVRVEEFVNFFDYADAVPRRSDFAITAEGAPSPFGEGERYYLLRFHLRARPVERARRAPADLIFVVDVSGSMARENRLNLVRQALVLLLDQLGPGDRVGLVTYGSRGVAVLEPTSEREAVRRALETLVAGGATNAEEGLVLGYEMARRNLREEAGRRVILCTDGVANIGRTGADSLLRRIEAEAEAGVELTAIGVGMGNYNDVLLEGLADRGNGRYAYVDSLEEARRIFVEGLTGTLQTVAKDARVQVEFDPAVVSRYRLLGYENRDIADERFRDDTVDAGEVGAGHQVTALYEVKLRPEARRRAALATLRLRYRSAATERVVEQELSIRLADFARDWSGASRELRLGGLVAEFAEILRGSYWAREGDLDELFRRAQRLAPEFEGDAEVAEFAGLVGKAARLRSAADPSER